MSKTANNSTRCDWCGRLTRAADCYYRRPDGTAGYIVQPEWERFPGGDHTKPNVQSANDICEECAANHCPACGSEKIVTLTPSVPGPNGWGGRCKACQYQWAMLPPFVPEPEPA